MRLTLVALLAFPIFASVDEPESEMIQREPAIEKLTPDEERLLPYIDDSGVLNGAITQKFQIPGPDLTEHKKTADSH